MECLYNELINVLDQEIATYSDILKVSKDKTTVIVEGKVKELEKIIQTEQTLILKVSKIENQREVLIFKISKALRKKPEAINLTTLIENCDEASSERLKIQQENFSKLIKELTDSNELNSKLIKSSLEYINFSLNLFTNAGNKDNNYGNDAEKSDPKSTSLLDLKV